MLGAGEVETQEETMNRSLWCFAHGRPGSWQAICVDLDIAVQGGSFEEVQQFLSHAISTYVEDAMQEEPAVRDRLLKRRAPLFTRLKCFASFFKAAIQNRKGSDESRHGFTLPCPV
jgi:hypothetical protein